MILVDRKRQSPRLLWYDKQGSIVQTFFTAGKLMAILPMIGVGFDPKALKLGIDFAGGDHVLAGSDYPHQIGSLGKMLSSIEALDLGSGDKARILGGNAEELLGL